MNSFFVNVIAAGGSEALPDFEERHFCGAISIYINRTKKKNNIAKVKASNSQGQDQI